jgi:hypothetical protein
MTSNTDWQGKEIPLNEPGSKIIDVWSVMPHPQSPNNYDELLCRSWQEMLDVVKNNLETFLERFDEEELREGVTLKFRLQRCHKADYDEVMHDE